MAIPWAGMAELTLIVGRLMSRSWSKHGTPREALLTRAQGA
jgi:hypothetical protein